jgi:UDP-GlcNAc:undecaprenyl-phosphate GlcNAc-1-phosphate transferase
MVGLSGITLANIGSYVWVPLVAFGVTLAATPVARRIAFHFDIVDKPNDYHKKHSVPVAYLGGSAVLLGLVTALLASYAMADPRPVSTQPTIGQGFPIWTILLGAVIVSVVGLIDDMRKVRARYRLIAQFIAASLPGIMGIGTPVAHSLVEWACVILGLDPQPIFGIGAGNEWLSPVFWLGFFIVFPFVMGGCNSTNLIDGMDGLCSGVIAIANAAFATIAILLVGGAYGYPSSDSPLFLSVPLAMMGAALGFLPYNYNPAKIYLGDGGSLLMGYVSIMSILLISREGGGPAMAAACLVILCLPILDTMMAIIRRLYRRRSIAAPDREHLHHMMLRRFRTVRRAVHAIYLVAFGVAMLGIGLTFAGRSFILFAVPAIFVLLMILAYFTLYRHPNPPHAADAPDPAPSRS